MDWTPDWHWIKALHVTTAAVSISLFMLRGTWLLRDSPRLRARWVRIVPHVNDTVLLLSAVALAALTHQYPGPQSWLTAKVIGLLVYIGLGLVALRFARRRPARIGTGLGAIAVFAYIVTVAVTRDPWPFFG